MVVSGQLDYSDTKVQQDLMSLLSDLENTTYIAPEYTESWLRDFLDYVRRQEEYDPVDISTEEKFIEALRLVINALEFFHHPLIYIYIIICNCSLVLWILIYFDLFFCS